LASELIPINRDKIIGVAPALPGLKAGGYTRPITSGLDEAPFHGANTQDSCASSASFFRFPLFLAVCFGFRASNFEFAVQHVHLFSRNRNRIAVLRADSCYSWTLRFQFTTCSFLREERHRNSRALGGARASWTSRPRILDSGYESYRLGDRNPRLLVQQVQTFFENSCCAQSSALWTAHSALIRRGAPTQHLNLT
jgi:hypothetical protein